MGRSLNPISVLRSEIVPVRTKVCIAASPTYGLRARIAYRYIQYSTIVDVLLMIQLPMLIVHSNKPVRTGLFRVQNEAKDDPLSIPRVDHSTDSSQYDNRKEPFTN